MPRLVHRNPKYRKHRASGQAVVTIDGRDHYLGPYGTKASHNEFDRLIGEWRSDLLVIANEGRKGVLTVLAKDGRLVRTIRTTVPPQAGTVAAYRKFGHR